MSYGRAHETNTDVAGSGRRRDRRDRRADPGLHDRCVRACAGEDALDAHGGFSLVVHVGELLIVIGAIWAWWGNWTAVGLAVAFLVLSVAQLAFLGDTDERGGWINGLHGFLALIVLLAGAWYFTHARRALGLGAAGTAAP
jgi:hypothetical protein